MAAVHRPHSTLVQQEGFAREAHAGPKTFRNGAQQAAQDAFPVPKVCEDPQMDAPVSLGTTIMAVAYDGGVVLAADSRTSTGTYVVNRASNKLTKLTDRVYCCRSGSAADTQAMAEMASHYLNFHAMTDGAPVTVASAAALFQRLCYQNRWNIQAGIIVAGWDPVNGGTVYNIPLGGASLKHHYAVGGSGSTYLYGWLDENFKVGMTKDQCVNFVRRAVAHAYARDGSSGGLIRTMSLSAEGAEHTTTSWTNAPYSLEKDPLYAKLAAQNQPISSNSRQTDNVEDSSTL
jgi:20S proteasome subunit beta 1